MHKVLECNREHNLLDLMFRECMAIMYHLGASKWEDLELPCINKCHMDKIMLMGSGLKM